MASNTNTMNPKVVKEIPPIKRNRTAKRETIAHNLAAFLLEHPNRWVKVSESPEDKRGTLANRRRELLQVSVPEGTITATTRSEGNGMVGLYARLEK